MANSVDPNQTPQTAASDLVLHCLQKPTCSNTQGWLGGAKVSCILRHWGVQLILAYSWARPAFLVTGKGTGGMFLFLLFLRCHSFSFLPCPSLSSPLLSLLSLFSLSLRDDIKWPTRVVKPQHNVPILRVTMVHHLFHSCSFFLPVPLFHLFYYLFYLFLPFLWETTQNDPQGLTCH